MKQQDIFASTQIVAFHPILKEAADLRVPYYIYLRNLLRLVKWDRRKYTRAQIGFYRERLCAEEQGRPWGNKRLPELRYCWLLPYDLAVMLGFHSKLVQSEKGKTVLRRIAADFRLTQEQADFLYTEFEAALGSREAWDKVLASRLTEEFRGYLQLVRGNIRFVRTWPCRVLITATMSAGKSTLINALAGKNISRMQNMACTSKVHAIVSKYREDGVTGQYDHALSMDAAREALLSDNEENESATITVGTYFHGTLAGKRIVLLDTPGVNSSENTDHAEISQHMIREGKYRLVLYVLNSEQLGTTDDARHLEAIRQNLGRARIIFVMNKADSLLMDENGIRDIIERQKSFLVSKGFTEPVICPVSARAAYLAKKSGMEALSRMERRELEGLMDDFEEQSLAAYYEQQLGRPHIEADGEEAALLVNCGFTHLEKILADFIKGRKRK